MIKIKNCFFIVVTLFCLLLTECKSLKGNKNVVVNLKCQGLSSTKDITATTDIIKERLIACGLGDEDIKIMVNADVITFDIHHVLSPERIISLISIRGDLGFWETYEFSEIYPDLEEANKKLGLSGIGKTDSTLKDNTNNEQISFGEYAKKNPLFAYLRPAFDQKDGKYYYGKGPTVGYVAIADTARVNAMLKSDIVEHVLSKDLKLLWEQKPFDEKKSMLRLIAIKLTNHNENAPIDGNAITDARQTSGHDSTSEISMTMNSEGTEIWKKITKENIGRCIAIVLDNYVYTFPTVNGEIPNGKSQITGNFTEDEAKDMAIILKYHKLPVSIKIIDSKITEEPK
jgi:SecD/SecF fusion protein